MYESRYTPVVELSGVIATSLRIYFITSPAVDETGAEPAESYTSELNLASAAESVELGGFEQFLESSTQIYAALNRMLLDEHKLSLFDVLLLDHLAKSENGSSRMGELADALILIASRVSQQVRRLESQGLVRRTGSRSDRRGVVATITREGIARRNRAMKTYARGVRTHYLNALSRQQMTALGESCRRISVALKESEVPAKFKRI